MRSCIVHNRDSADMDLTAGRQFDDVAPYGPLCLCAIFGVVDQRADFLAGKAVGKLRRCGNPAHIGFAQRGGEDAFVTRYIAQEFAQTIDILEFRILEQGMAHAAGDQVRPQRDIPLEPVSRCLRDYPPRRGYQYAESGYPDDDESGSVFYDHELPSMVSRSNADESLGKKGSPVQSRPDPNRRSVVEQAEETVDNEDNEGQSNNSCIVTLTLIILIILTLIILINPGFRKQRSTQATDAGELAGGVVGKREGRVAKMRISL